MKLSKGKFQTILILAIVLAAYLLLAFVIPFTKTAVFWLALVFTLAAFGLQLYVLKLSFTKGKDARSKFYGFPIARIGVMYLIVQIALSFLFMAIAKFCAAWIAVIVFALLLAVTAVGVIAADAMRDEVERQDAQLKAEATARDRCEQMIFQAGNAKNVSKEDKTRLAEAVKTARRAVKSKDPAQMNGAADQLEALLNEAGVHIDPNAEYHGSARYENPNNDFTDNAVDAEFEEMN